MATPSDSDANGLSALDEAFAPCLVGLDLAEIAASSDSILVVDADLRIRGYNRTYLAFARANGQVDIAERYGIGRLLLDAFSEPARSFYARVFTEAIARHEAYHQCYECPSPRMHREYRLSAYPIAGGHGLLLCHHLVASSPISADEAVAESSAHRSPDGFIVQCCHCRKVQNFQVGQRWDWVTDLVERQADQVSHTFCPRCLDFYYPDPGDD